MLFTHSLATQLHPVMDGVTFAGGFDCVRSQRRINARRGKFARRWTGVCVGKGRSWCIVKAPWMIKSGMTLRLRSDGGKRQHLWLAADSMDVSRMAGFTADFVATETQR
ncbi:protein YgfX [Shigella flexneri]